MSAGLLIDGMRVDLTRSFLLTVAFSMLLAAIWFGAWQFGGALPDVIPSVGLWAALTGLAWFDIDHYRIPDWISLPLILAGLTLAYLGAGSGFPAHVLGAALGFGTIWGLNAYWRYRHGKDGIGLGDAKLLAAAGAWLGVLALAPVALIASGSALALLLTGRFLGKASMVPADQHIAFGPFIALGFWSIWLFG